MKVSGVLCWRLNSELTLCVPFGMSGLFVLNHQTVTVCESDVSFVDCHYSQAGVKLTTMEQDQLRELFRMQKALNERIGVQTESMSEEQKTEWVLNYCRAMNQELAELTDSVPWKWWAKYQEFDEQNARVEVVDLFHFLISMAQVLGMSADDVFQAYLKKNEVNFKRQESGYTEKDQSDSKHI